MARNYTEEDRETLWADNEDMRKKTTAYAEGAKLAVEKGILGGFTNHPWEENAYHGPWRLRIFELEGGHCDMPNGPPQFESTRDLLSYWESTPIDGATEKRHRRLIFLEDLSARIAEFLGVLLDIPAEFFLAHCAADMELSVVNKQLRKQGGSKYWKVPVPRRCVLPEAFRRTCEGYYNIECGAFNRGRGHVSKGSDGIFPASFVSYWAKSYEGGSWTAVILTDPHLLRLYYCPTSDPYHSEMIHLENYTFQRTGLFQVMLDSVEDRFVQPNERPIFDALVKAHHDLSLELTEDPFSATYIARNCIRALWEQQIWEDELTVSYTMHGNVWYHQISHSANASEGFDQKMVANGQTVKAYQFIMEYQQNIKSNRNKIRVIAWKFRLRDADYLSAETPELRSIIKEEAKLWKFLDEKLQGMEDILGDHMKMFSARSAMEEAYEAKIQSRESMRQTEEANRQTATANRMARSSGQLTKIATIVVPCTFVASIFSMGGDFAAGESLFYIYWIVSVPITLGLLCWVIHEDISDAMEKSKKWMSSRKTKLSEESKM